MSVTTFGDDVRFDPQAGELWVFGSSVVITQPEYRALLRLYEADGALVEKEDLVRAAWPNDQYAFSGRQLTPEAKAKLDQLIFRLRRKMREESEQPRYLLTVKNRGYRLNMSQTIDVKGCLKHPTTASDLVSRGAEIAHPAQIARASTIHAELERLRQELMQEGQRRRELKGETIVGLRFADVTEVFRDRLDAAAHLRRLLRDQTAKLICIVGRGGVGKTALLSKICAEVEQRELCLSDEAVVTGANGIIYISCRGSDRPTVERVVHDVGRMLGTPHAEELLDCWLDSSRSLEAKVRFLLSRLRQGCYLLVLDNLEDILASDNTIAEADLRTFVELCLVTPHALRLVATSRSRLVVSGPGMRAVRTVPLESGLPCFLGGSRRSMLRRAACVGNRRGHHGERPDPDTYAALAGH